LAPIRRPRLGQVIFSSFSCFSLPRQRGFGEAGARRVQPRGSLQQAAHVLQNPGPRHRSRHQRHQLLVSLRFIHRFSLHLMSIYMLFSRHRFYLNMDQTAIKTPNLKGRLFIKIDLTAGVYMSEAPDPPPPPTHCMNTCTPVLYLSTQGRGGDEPVRRLEGR
jgi:hypothetical protein